MLSRGRDRVTRRKFVTLVIALVSIASTWVYGVPASAAPPAQAPGGSAEETMREQWPYLDAYEKIKAYSDGLDDSPMAGARLDLPNHRLVVYWAAAFPKQLRAITAAAAADGVTIVLQRARSSESTLQAAANQIAVVAAGSGLAIVVAEDGSGLTVEYPSAGSGLAASARARIAARIQTVESASGVPIRQTEGERVVVPTDARDADTSPFAGGAGTRVQYQTGSPHYDCTDGFSMYATGSSARFMLTAAHCTGFTDGFLGYTFAGAYIGVTDFNQELFWTGSGYDLAVIRLASSVSNEAKIWKTDTTKWSIGGYASGGILQGATYCISGTVGVPNCNLFSGAQVRLCPGDISNWPRCTWFIHFTSTAGDIVCFGDSGAPIYFTNPSGQKIAAGIQSLGAWPTPPAPGDTCMPQAYISVVASAVNNVNGLRVLTG
jgi:hypothetical protein